MPFSPIEFVFLMLLLVVSSETAVVNFWGLASFFPQSLEFKIQSSYSACEQPLNNRCTTHYLVESKDGKVADFVPGRELDGFALQKGVEVYKVPFSLTYSLNGKTEQWPFLWQHALAFIFGVLGMLVWSRIGGPRVLKAWGVGFVAQWREA